MERRRARGSRDGARNEITYEKKKRGREKEERKVTADPSMCLTRCSILSLVHFSAVRL